MIENLPVWIRISNWQCVFVVFGKIFCTSIAANKNRINTPKGFCFDVGLFEASTVYGRHLGTGKAAALLEDQKISSNVPSNFFVLPVRRKFGECALFLGNHPGFCVWNPKRFSWSKLSEDPQKKNKIRWRPKKRSSPKIERCLCPKSLLPDLLL